MIDMTTQTVTVPRTAANPAVAALAALFLGAALILVAGFAWPSYLHNATHDTRHALGLPCH